MDTPLYGVKESSPRWKNGFGAFHRAKLSSQETQVNTVGCIVLKKKKIPFDTELHAHAYLPLLVVLRRPGSYEVYVPKRMPLLHRIYFRCYKTAKMHRSNKTYRFCKY